MTLKSIVRKSFFFISVAIISVTCAPLQVLADETFYSGNDILFYDKNASPDVCATSGSNLVGGDNVERAWNFFIGRSLSSQQTAGILGNLLKESGGSGDLDPGIEEVTTRADKGYGIAQWTFGRRDALEQAARNQGVPSSDLGFQLEYLYQEMEVRKTSPKATNKGLGSPGDTEIESMKKMTSIIDATVLFHDSFERSADTAQEVIDNRGGAAQEVFNRLSSNTAGGGSGPNANCAQFTGGDLQETAFAYAWPEYHSPPYTNKKPEYDAAVSRAQTEGRYVGGLQYPGIDCGGFVTTLMIDSGFEPEYNYSGKGGNTVTQEQWVKDNWTTLGNGSSIDTSTLLPGDVAFSTRHTFVYVGDIDGFDSNIASASLGGTNRGWRSPMAGRESLTSSSVTWYRKG